MNALEYCKDILNNLSRRDGMSLREDCKDVASLLITKVYVDGGMVRPLAIEVDYEGALNMDWSTFSVSVNEEHKKVYVDISIHESKGYDEVSYTVSEMDHIDMNKISRAAAKIIKLSKM